MSTFDKPLTSTPRTDQAAALVQYAIVGEQYQVVTAEFARELEREVATEKAKRKRWQEIADRRAIEVADLKRSSSTTDTVERDLLERALATEWYSEHSEDELRARHRDATGHDAPDHMRGEPFEKWAEAEGYIRGSTNPQVRTQPSERNT